MTTLAPSLTEAELNDLANSDGRFGPHTLDRVVAQCRRALTLESELAQLRQVAAEIAEARRVDGERIGAAETELLLARSELEQLRREKAEREELERRRDEWLGYNARSVHHCISALSEPVHIVDLFDALDGTHERGTGPTYEAALAAALEKVEKA